MQNARTYNIVYTETSRRASTCQCCVWSLVQWLALNKSVVKSHHCGNKLCQETADRLLLAYTVFDSVTKMVLIFKSGSVGNPDGYQV